MTKKIRDTPQPSTPWWQGMIEGFYGLEIKPCKVIGFASSDGELMFPCEPSLATCWVVYGLYRLHGRSGGAEELERFRTQLAAQAFLDRLRADYPNLSSTSPRHPRGNYVYL